ncbi:hypothetical protein [Mycobacterium sp. C31M]
MRVLLALVLTAGVLAAAPAHADTPQPNSGCPADLTGATTMPPGQSLPLRCTGQHWEAQTVPGDPSDRWVSFGPDMALHGEGLRNPNLSSGSWTATPLDAETRCSATQKTVITAGVVGAPVAAEGATGQPLTLVVLPRLFDITMAGHCLWERIP